MRKQTLTYASLILAGLFVGAGIGYRLSPKQPPPPPVEVTQPDKQTSSACKVEVPGISEEKASKQLGENLSESEIAAALSYVKFNRIREQVMPSGSPDYGSQLDVAYDQAAQAVDTLAKLEQKIGQESLNKKQKERYIKIGTTGGTACEFCCGLTSGDGFARSKGQRQCGCAHNIAFSGLTMWMIKNGYSNQNILEEIAKWKASFFPKQTLTHKLQEMKKNNPEVDKILEEFPAFMPQMVGGC